MAYELLDVEKRDTIKSSYKLRNEGIIPGILFGGGKESVEIQVSERILVKCLRKGHKVFEIKVADGEKYLINLGEIQRHPVKRNILHASFHTLNQNEETKVTIPIIITGEAEGIKKGGILIQQLSSIEVTGLPKDIPESVTLDVSDLQVGHGKFIKDITPPTGIKFHKEDLERAVATCNQPKAEAEVASTTTSAPVLEGDIADATEKNE